MADDARKTGTGLNELDSAYLKLGRAYYEGGYPEQLPQLRPIMEKIARIEREEEEIKRQASTGCCPRCGSPVEKDALFCGSCGMQLR